MTINLDELERIAKAGDPWGYAATPKNILELIAEVRRLREDAERWRSGAKMHKFPEYGTGDRSTWVWYIADVEDEFDTPEAALDAACKDQP